MNGLSILPECYIDTCLIETITLCFNQFNHQKGCGTVVKKMQEVFHDSFAVGVIDKDKQEVFYLREFKLIASNESLFLYKHSDKHHYIIQIYPAIERFFLKAATEKGIDIAAKYNLPTDIKSLTRITKQISGKDEKAFTIFRQLFKEISDTSEIRRLSTLIRYLGNHTYSADVEELKGIVIG